MFSLPTTCRVEVSFVGSPPTAQVTRATGVSNVERTGHTIRCLVFGSFQPFLEALRGHEVERLISVPELGPTANVLRGDDR